MSSASCGGCRPSVGPRWSRCHGPRRCARRAEEAAQAWGGSRCRSRRLRRTFSVLLADVDHFKQYNDTHGHLGGDAALVKIAEILRQTTRGVDSVARYGGEEFVVMLIEAPIATAAAVGERLRERVAGEEFGGGRVTVSVGAAEYPTHGETPEELIASADAAMYQAENAGRDRVAVAGRRAEREQEGKRRRKGEG